jgi:cytochrome c peroxidase
MVMMAFRSLPIAAVLATHAAASSLEIIIEPVFQGEPLRLDSLCYPNAAGETLSVTRLSYLLSGFALEQTDGQWVELPGTLAWMDSASRRNSVLLDQLPGTTYRSIRFHIGPDPTANATDVAKFPAGHPLNPNLNGLHWSWQGGFIFMAVEGLFRSGSSEPKGYAHHLARDPNRTRISLNAPLDLTQDAAVVIHFDLANLLNAPRPLSFEKDGAATHSREGDPIAAALVANLPGAFGVNRQASVAPMIRNRLPVTPIDLPGKFTPYRFVMSRTFPIPDLPRDNPLMEERIALGEKLFHDTGLSRDGSISCATCHHADAAFTDRLPLSIGIDGRTAERNAMPLFNLAWKREFFWDGRAPSLREQVLMPITDHREMDESLENVIAKLTASPDYAPLFAAAFRSEGITAEKIALALEQFLLTLSARDAKFDQAIAGKTTLTDQEARGFELFMTEYEPRTGQLGADCFHCHGGALFSDHQFHNNGLSGNDPGRAKVTGSPGDHGKFSTPSLRNIAITAPYMHDGRFATLEEVVEHYSSGIQRGPTLDPNLAKHPANGLNLSAADKAALVAFLKTLTSGASATP